MISRCAIYDICLFCCFCNKETAHVGHLRMASCKDVFLTKLGRKSLLRIALFGCLCNDTAHNHSHCTDIPSACAAAKVRRCAPV